ncbi:DUF4367 domain-containing protein [Paenibacillus lautus]|uniref:DUF4367 domain-containing protein n=1 Tax=Paenibacillus lautus TaxID=1401 RepID=UPI000FDB19F9|nr:DUF4367 domain-containing protein [Paenibacillus lautus]
MKKQLAVAALASALVLGGGGFAYYSYAADADGKTVVPVVESSLATIQNEEASVPESSSPSQETVEIKPETTVGPGVQDPDTVDIADVSVADIHIPLLKDNASATLSSSGLTRINIQALQKEYGLHLRSLLTTTDGDEIRIFQVDANMGVSDAIESLKADYSPETSELIEINGLKALYVDGEVRKVVHLISEDHLYTISANTATLEELMDIAKQIHE